MSHHYKIETVDLAGQRKVAILTAPAAWDVFLEADAQVGVTLSEASITHGEQEPISEAIHARIAATRTTA